ncbi:pilus assembly PilX family protein [Horticoccus sp. 23ND18S-11]|uniref:pilus assembly PilX family protein n=1 Tax=Horticoccus sp. 23ND18S-11 TaxID=3391832 RepID=UPI0039C99AE8
MPLAPSAFRIEGRVPAGQRWRGATRQRGAVLIVALLFVALIALGLASYLNLNLASGRLAKRTFNSYAALNLAEAGTEEAVWSYNRASAGATDAWNAWTQQGAAATQRFSGFDLGPGTTGWVKVYVESREPGPTMRPKVIAQSSAVTGNDAPVTKMIEVTLRRRSMFANAMVARDAIVFSGANTTVDAWNSDPDGNPLTPAVDYDSSLRTDRGTIGTMSLSNTALLVNEAHIWGYVATGGAQPGVGSTGSIRGSTTPVGVRIDPARIATDFNVNLTVVPAPVDGTFLASIPAVLGVAGTPTKWRAQQLTLNGNQTLTILGDVTLTLTASSGADAVSVTGNASIIIPAGSSLALYTEGGVRIAGNGLANANVQPLSCQIWGTNSTPAGQSIQVAGNGSLRAVIYAPNGDVMVNGNGDVMGSIISRTIRFTGNAAFHYDEALATGRSGEPYAIDRWRELNSAADRAPYLARFEGW